MAHRTLQLFLAMTTVALATGCQSSGARFTAQVADNLLGTRTGRMGPVEYLSSGLKRVETTFGTYYVHPEHLVYYEAALTDLNALAKSGKPDREIEEERCALARRLVAGVPKPTHPKADSVWPLVENARKQACWVTAQRIAKATAEEEARRRRAEQEAAQREQEAARREQERQRAEAQKRRDTYVNGSWGYTDRICALQADIDTLESINDRELKVAARSGFVNRVTLHNNTLAIVYIEEQRDHERAAYQARFGKSFTLSRCKGWTVEAASERQQVAGIW